MSTMKKYTINLNTESMEVIESHFIHTGIPRNQIIRELVDRFASTLLTPATVKPIDIFKTTVSP